MPRPAMAILDQRDLWVEIDLYEAAHHGSNSWHYLLAALEDVASMPEVEAQHMLVDEAYSRWQDTDDLGPILSAAKEAPAPQEPPG